MMISSGTPSKLSTGLLTFFNRFLSSGMKPNPPFFASFGFTRNLNRESGSRFIIFCQDNTDMRMTLTPRIKVYSNFDGRAQRPSSRQSLHKGTPKYNQVARRVCGLFVYAPEH